MNQGLALVDLRVRSMTQSCMPPAGVRRTAARPSRCQELLHPQKAPSRGHKHRRWDDPGRADGSRPSEGDGTWSRTASLPDVGETARLSLPVSVVNVARGCRLTELLQKCDVVPNGFFAGPWPKLWSLSSCMGRLCPAGVSSRGAVPEMRCVCHIVPDIQVYIFESNCRR